MSDRQRRLKRRLALRPKQAARNALARLLSGEAHGEIDPQTRRAVAAVA